MQRWVWPKRKSDRGTGMQTQSFGMLDAGLMRLREALRWGGKHGGRTGHKRLALLLALGAFSMRSTSLTARN